MSFSIRNNSRLTVNNSPLLPTQPQAANYWSLDVSQNIFNNNDSGRVGIGTPNPQYNLDVSGTARIANTLFVDNVNNRIGVNKITPSYSFDVSGIANSTFLRTNFLPSYTTNEPSLIINGGPLLWDISNINQYTRVESSIYIGSQIDLSGDPYSCFIGGYSRGGTNNYFNTTLGVYTEISGNTNGAVAIGYNTMAYGSDAVAIGRKVRAGYNNCIVGGQGGGNRLTTGISNTAFGNYAGGRTTTGSNNTFIGAGSANNTDAASIVTGSGNIALGTSAGFPSDVSNCISINNQNNSSFGGLFGQNLGTSNFQLGINKNDPAATLDVSGNISTNFLSKNITIPGKLITINDISTAGTTILDLSAITLNSFNFTGGSMVLTGNYRLQTNIPADVSNISATFVIKTQAGTVIATGPDISGVPTTSTTFLQIPFTPLTYSSNFSAYGGQTLRLDMNVNRIVDISQNIDLQNVRLTFRYPSRVLTLDASTNSISVGIGTANPSYRLDISSSDISAMRVGNVLYVDSSTNRIGLGTNAPRTNLDISGNITTNQGSTNMTNGFIYVPSSAGKPTGIPTSITGSAPVYADISNNNLWVYGASGWRGINLNLT